MGNCVNSMEQEIREITDTVPVIKSWLVLVERKVLVCSQNGKSMLSPFNFLSCMSNEGNREEKCIYWQNVGCGLVERDGHVLHFKSLHTRRPLHVRVDVNRIFSLNLSFTNVYLCNKRKTIVQCMNYMDLRIANMSERYTQDRLPWTVISKHASAMISVNSPDFGLHVEFEYSIAEKSNQEYTARYGIYKTHSNYFPMEIVNIAVESIYRVHVEISRCFRCKIIAHDGPHEIFPTILHKRIGPRGFTSFSTSAHYSLVLVTNETQFNTMVIRYYAVFVVHTTFTLGSPTQLVFDNNTRCNDNTQQVRSCVFKIRAPDDSNVKLILTEMQIKGVYAGNEFAAGFIVYNVVRAQLKKVSVLLGSLGYFPLHGIPFTSTESTMYVVVFSYSVCASIFVQAVATAERCNGIFVEMDRPTTTAIVHFDNSTDTQCFRLQTIFFSGRKSILAKWRIHIGPSITVLIELSSLILYRDMSRCHFNLFNDLRDILNVRSEKGGDQSYFGNIIKVDWECSPTTKIMITEIKTASCALPCRLLFNNKGLEHSSLFCDVCRFKYLGGSRYTYSVSREINRTTLFDLHIYPSHCVTVDLQFYIDPMSSWTAISVDVNRNQTFSMASQLGVSLHYDSRCMIRLPRQALPIDIYGQSKPQTMREPINLIWGEHLYRVLLSDQFLSWTYTARECKKYGGYLLVVHNQMEYQQIEYLMHKIAIGVLYIGSKRKVNRTLLSIVTWSNNLALCFVIWHN